ncbi:unnamed protein product, partial [Brenthis ino]
MTESSLDLQELEKLRSTNLPLQKKCQNIVSPEVSHKWRLILEPALVGAMMAINLGQTSLQNFYLRTACHVDLNFSLDICEKGVGEEFRIAEGKSQEVVSSINVSRSFVGLILSTIILLFVGPWSDYSGRRKPLLILPLLGMCVMTIGVLLMLTFPGANTIQVLYAVQIPISLGGNFGLLLAASFSYIGDLCHASGRDVTRTMGTHRAAIQIAHVVGSVSGPQLYHHLGFYGVFPLVLFLQASSLIYVIIMVKDVNVNRDNKVSVLNWRLPLNAVQCLVRKREGYKRITIFLMLFVGLGDRVLLSAEVLLAYMYYRFKFQWDDVIFGFFLAYRNTISFIGTIIILNILKRRMRLCDEVVGVLSCLSYMFATSSLIAASTTLFVFIIPIIGIISQGSQVVQRPLLNKQILPTEQGKIYGILGALECATQAFSSPLYSLLYAKTVSIVPDAWLVPGIVLALLQLFSYLLTRRLQNIQPDNISQQEKNMDLQATNYKQTEDTKELDLIDKDVKSVDTKCAS